jgi:hypothetical protein
MCLGYLLLLLNYDVLSSAKGHQVVAKLGTAAASAVKQQAVAWNRQQLPKMYLSLLVASHAPPLLLLPWAKLKRW